MNATFSFMNQFLPIGFSVLLLFFIIILHSKERTSGMHAYIPILCWDKGERRKNLNQNLVKHMAFSSPYHVYRKVKKCVATDIVTFSTSELLF